MPRTDMTRGPVPGTLLRLAAPLTVGIFAVLTFNLADTWFVSRLGTEALAAMGFTFPVVMVLMGVSFSLSSGTASVVARAIGAGDEDRVRRLASDSLSLSFLVVLAVAIVGMLTIDPLFTLLGAGPEVLPLIRDYMLIWYPGAVFLVVPIVANASIRAGGDTRFPAAMMVAAMALNLVLDPVLIFGLYGAPRLELAGAAWATVIARFLTFLGALAVLHFREGLLDFRTPSLRQVLSSWAAIARVAVPVSATNTMQPVAIGVVTRLIADFGPASVAAWGAGERVTAFVLVPIFAVCSGMVPLAGQNWGARRFDRVRAARNTGFLLAGGWGLLTMAVLWVLDAQVAGLFGDDPELVRQLSRYLWIMPLSYALYGVLNINEELLNAIGRPLAATGQTAVHMFLLFAPLGWLGAWRAGFEGLLWGIVAANLLGGLVALEISRRACRPA